MKISLMSLLMIYALTSAHAQLPDYKAKGSYCAAIRGNGELAPAHWGAMAKLVENYGMPAAMAGGSSASVNMFLLESIAMNPLLVNLSVNGPEYRMVAALLIKSLGGYVNYLMTLPEANAVRTLAKDGVLKQKLMALVEKFKGHSTPQINAVNMVQVQMETLNLATEYQQEITELNNSTVIKNLLNPELVRYIAGAKDLALKLSGEQDLDKAQKLQAQVMYRFNEIQDAVEMFGKFNAQTDNNLFFRHGIISFKSLSKLLGRIANFYAGYNFDETDHHNLNNFVKTCQYVSQSRSWEDTVKNEPICHNLLMTAIETHRSRILAAEEAELAVKAAIDGWLHEGLSATELATKVNDLREEKGLKGWKWRVTEGINKKITAIPTTAVLVGAAVNKFHELVSAYETTVDPNFGAQFVPDYNQVMFGYFGSQSNLHTIETNLRNEGGFFVAGQNGKQKFNFSNDRKSKKFRSLGESSWENVLKTSPAEPGLSRGVKLDNSHLISIGGWSDLHPVLVLKALECRNVIYVSRVDGETLFGQGVIKRLMGISGIEWDMLATIPNNNGNPDDLTSQWSKLYNLANPNSSLSLSIDSADGVYCTNWNRHPVENGILPLLQDAYQAPLYVKDENNQFLRNSSSPLIEKSDNTFDPLLGYKKYAGCIPL